MKGKIGLIVSEAGEESNRGKKKIKTGFLKLCSGDGVLDSDVKYDKNRARFEPRLRRLWTVTICRLSRMTAEDG